MHVTATAVSLTVPDPAASSFFLQQHFGFREDVAAAGFASLTRDDVGMHVALVVTGMPTLPEPQRERVSGGLIRAIVVDDLEGELARLQAEGVAITMPLTVEEWGERAFQVQDPNGVVVQLVDWQGATA